MNDRLLQLFMHAWVVLTSMEKIVREFIIIVLKRYPHKHILRLSLCGWIHYKAGHFGHFHDMYVMNIFAKLCYI